MLKPVLISRAHNNNASISIFLHSASEIFTYHKKYIRQCNIPHNLRYNNEPKNKLQQ